MARRVIFYTQLYLLLLLLLQSDKIYAETIVCHFPRLLRRVYGWQAELATLIGQPNRQKVAINSCQIK